MTQFDVVQRDVVGSVLDRDLIGELLTGVNLGRKVGLDGQHAIAGADRLVRVLLLRPLLLLLRPPLLLGSSRLSTLLLGCWLLWIGPRRVLLRKRDCRWRIREDRESR